MPLLVDDFTADLKKNLVAAKDLPPQGRIELAKRLFPELDKAISDRHQPIGETDVALILASFEEDVLDPKKALSKRTNARLSRLVEETAIKAGLSLATIERQLGNLLLDRSSASLEKRVERTAERLKALSGRRKMHRNACCRARRSIS